ncbi:Uncharacterised protein [Chryseobacterium gleum]|uniref:PIN domain-containing protein n=2 Tax=Chryseobacterium gleum TaxID=250 RepID=A0A3S5E361_CHRGE|nr:hypothetical protein [Chryseobacterium gleum]EFK36863.1 hypothetical protein HMPREF0204_11420 [Chryseobacterium gleum ATCC 35910]QQY32111.1 hypothetical protein I6I60_25320 [Chryseobacterium gleum]VEE10664.1 Uncharacterised protein [Chryseobacterium gleum]
MVTEKRISEWENILVDTSILCALFKAVDEGSVDEQFLFVKKLMHYLSNTKTGNSKDRRFFITSITVSELLSKEDDREKIAKIVRILDSQNVEFIDFDLGSAFLLNNDFREYLSRKKLNNFAAEMGFKSGDFMMAREWISKDMMIIQNGKFANVDVILTCDKNTFYPISEKCSVFTALAYEEYFKHDHGIMLAYLHDIAKLNYIALN